jgi:hypothetical protein
MPHFQLQSTLFSYPYLNKSDFSIKYFDIK